MNEESLLYIYNKVIERVLKIKEIFNDYYEEENVDLQKIPCFNYFKCVIALQTKNKVLLDCSTKDYKEITDEDINTIKNQVFNNNSLYTPTILIHFPKVRVTNEYNRYIDITHLYVKVKFNYDGKSIGYFLLNRSEYTEEQFLNNYMHSHVSSIPKHNFEEFKDPCLGTGPIKNTLITLAKEFDENIWRLFCLELDKYVHTESVSGVPYIGLEKVTDYYNAIPIRLVLNPIFHTDDFLNSENINSFLKFLFKENVLSFNYHDGQYGIAMSSYDYIIKVSNCFIKWYNEAFNLGICTLKFNNLKSKKIIETAIVKNGVLYSTSIYPRTAQDFSSYIGKEVCVFKDEIIRLNIKNDESHLNNNITILNIDILNLILVNILKIINIHYGKENSTGESNTTTSSEIYYYL